MVRVESAYVTGRLVEASDSTTNGNGEGATADPEAGSQRLAQAPRGPDAAQTVLPDAMLGASDLAAQYNVEPEALRKRLDRWRRTTPMDGLRLLTGNQTILNTCLRFLRSCP